MAKPFPPVRGESPTSVGSLSVVIPVYNSEAVLPQLLQRLEPVLVALECPFEVIFVNDGSMDRSWEVIQQLAQQYPFLRGINLMRNYGQHNALLCGIRVARYAIIITMDDDLQNPPEEIPNLLVKLEESYDVAYGVPMQEKQSMWRRMATAITVLALQSAMGAATARKVSSYRAFRKEVRDAFATYNGLYVSIDVLLTWGTTRFTSVLVQHDPRRVGHSNYTFRKLATHAINMITGFSVLPLQIASILGFGFTLFGVLVFIYVLGRYLIQGGSVPGFPFLASIIAIFSGVQMFALGVIGEYLARVYYRISERPAYIIRQAIEFGQESPHA